MTGVPQLQIETVPEEDISRRSFLQMGGACLAGGLLLPSMINGPLAAQILQPEKIDRMWGVAMAYGEGRLDLIDLDDSSLLHSFEGIRASNLPRSTMTSLFSKRRTEPLTISPARSLNSS